MNAVTAPCIPRRRGKVSMNAARVGTGTPCKNGGEWTGLTSKCPNGDNEKPILNHCDDPLCPKCAGVWVDKRARITTRRLLAFEEVAKKNRLNVGEIRHFSVSPPEGVSPDIYLKKVIPLLRWGGLVAGAIVYHPERQYDKKKHLWRFSPHFHVHGYGWVRKADEFFKKTGWVYKNKGTRKKLYDSVRYNFDHCGIIPGRHAVRYFGLLGYKNFKRAVVETLKVPVVCPKCQAEMQLIKEYEGGLSHTSAHYEVIEVVRYSLPFVRRRFQQDLHGVRRRLPVIYIEKRE